MPDNVPIKQRFLFSPVVNRSKCAFAILTIIVLNFSTSDVQTNRFKSISQKFGNILNSFALLHFHLSFLQRL